MLLDHRVLSATDEMIKYLEIGNRMLIDLVESIGKQETGSRPDFKDLQSSTELDSGKIASFTAVCPTAMSASERSSRSGFSPSAKAITFVGTAKGNAEVG